MENDSFFGIIVPYGIPSILSAVFSSASIVIGLILLMTDNFFITEVKESCNAKFRFLIWIDAQKPNDIMYIVLDKILLLLILTSRKYELVFYLIETHFSIFIHPTNSSIIIVYINLLMLVDAALKAYQNYRKINFI